MTDDVQGAVGRVTEQLEMAARHYSTVIVAAPDLRALVDCLSAEKAAREAAERERDELRNGIDAAMEVLLENWETSRTPRVVAGRLFKVATDCSAELKAGKARAEAAEKRVAELGADIEAVAKERDEAEQAIGGAYYAIFGQSPEWSNEYSFDDAVLDIRLHREKAEAATQEVWAHAHSLEARIAPLQAQVATMRSALVHAIEYREGWAIEADAVVASAPADLLNERLAEAWEAGYDAGTESNPAEDLYARPNPYLKASPGTSEVIQGEVGKEFGASEC